MKIRHLILDAKGCSGPLDEGPLLLAALRRGVATVGAREVGSAEVRYVPHGVTVVLILAESHAILSTWPEYRLALLEVLLCNESMDPEGVWQVMGEVLLPGEVVKREILRVVGPPDAE